MFLLIFVNFSYIEKRCKRDKKHFIHNLNKIKNSFKGYLFLLSKESQNRFLDNIVEIFDSFIHSTQIQYKSFTLTDLVENFPDVKLSANIFDWFLINFCHKNGKKKICF